jgi:hypothetical protein
MKERILAWAVCVVLALTVATTAGRQARYRTLNDTFDPPKIMSVDEWKHRAEYLREHILATAGLLPMPEKTPLNPEVFGEAKYADHTMSKVYFESLPGFFVTGNLYRPRGNGPFPAILSPHGHWPYGRLENSALASVPGRAINLARQGFVVFTYDMIGYNDSRQLPHTFGGRRENLWGLSLAGLQLWNSIRALDFLESLTYVRRDAIGATGASGGGTQTFLLAAVDERVAVAAPVNMISLHMQGGCLCENQPGLRLDTTNVEIASTIAPRPLLMVSATGDWTKNTMEREYPAVRRVYELLGVPERVHALRIDADHNYNRSSREAMYAWMARWLQQAPADVSRPERSFTPAPLPDALVFHQRSLPASAVTAEQLTDTWVGAAKRQLAATPIAVRARALSHTLGIDVLDDGAARPRTADGPRTVILASADAELERSFKEAGFTVRPLERSAFDAESASKVRHFETYNRTAAGQLVADIVAALRASPGAVLVAGADAGPAGLLAAALAPVDAAVLDFGAFDTRSDEDFLNRLYIPGLRRVGDLQTAAAVSKATLFVHNAGPDFRIDVSGSSNEVRRQKLPIREIVTVVRTATRRQSGADPR